MKPNKQIIQEFQEIHKDKYDYSKVNYLGALKKVNIICKIHGIFPQTPNNHLKGKGCKKCSSVAVPSNDGIISKFKDVHHNLYEYSKVNYKTMHEKVDIICKIHGIFQQTPANHYYQQQHCPTCSGQNRYDDIETYIYYIKIDYQYKVGLVQKKKAKDIIAALNRRYYYEIKNNIKFDIINSKLFKNGKVAYNIEQNIINNNNNHLIPKDKMLLYSGFSETFSCDIKINLDDFDKNGHLMNKQKLNDYQF